MHLGPRLKQLRLSAGLKQSELARRIGCSTSTVANVELGQRQPSVEVLGSWLAATGAELRIVADGEVRNERQVIDDDEAATLAALRKLDTPGWTAAMLVIRGWPKMDRGERRAVLGLLVALNEA